MRSMMKLAGAYYDKPSLGLVIREMLMGLRTKARPEAQVFGFSRLLKGWTVMDRLGEIDVPTLVMAGRSDFQFPPEHQEALAAAIPNARLAIVDRAGHNAPMERPAEVMAAVRRFFDDYEPGPVAAGKPAGPDRLPVR
jgi:proline iminopeptidase